MVVVASPEHDDRDRIWASPTAEHRHCKGRKKKKVSIKGGKQGKSKEERKVMMRYYTHGRDTTACLTPSSPLATPGINKIIQK